MLTDEDIENARIANVMIFYTEALKNCNMGFVPLVYGDIVPGLYLINPNGDIFSIRSNRCLCKNYDKDNYLTVTLDTIHGKRSRFRIYKLVASTFVINPFPNIYTQVNHIIENNGTPERDHYDNLEWCTGKQNIYHAIDNNLIKRDERGRFC